MYYIYSFISIVILACLHSPSVIVYAVSAYTSLVHAKACEYENYKNYENKYFVCIRLCEISLSVYFLRMRRSQWGDVSVR